MSRKRILRMLSAVIASIVAIMMGDFAVHAECGLKDVAEYREAMTSSTQELDPPYLLKTAEAFIAKCPERWELREVHLKAARAGLDSGEAKTAIDHYEAALDLGAHMTAAQMLDYSAALLSTGKRGQATKVRDSAIAIWAMRLTGDEAARLTRIDVKGGAIYKARFERVDPKLKISALWIAAPTGHGWPAAAALRPDAQRAAWKRLKQRTAPSAELKVVELYQCRGRQLLREGGSELMPEDAEDEILRALKAYLKAPDNLEATDAGRPIASCIYHDRMLYRPDPVAAIPVN